MPRRWCFSFFMWYIHISFIYFSESLWIENIVSRTDVTCDMLPLSDQQICNTQKQVYDGEQHLCFLLGFTPDDREWRSATHFRSLYDKRDDFNFHITNFPFLSSNIPSSPDQKNKLIRYARACSSYGCFILRAARLSSKLLGQGYVMERLKTSLRKLYRRYGDLIKHYEVSLSQMLHDILGHDHLQWHPQLIRHYTYLRTYYRTGLYYRFWPYYLIMEVSIERCNGCGYPTEDAYSSGHLVLSHLGLACVLMLRPFFPELVMSTDLLSVEHPSVLLFCLTFALELVLREICFMFCPFNVCVKTTLWRPPVLRNFLWF